MSEKSYLVFDLETIVNHELWTPPPEAPETFPPQFAHQVIAAGALWLDERLLFSRLGIVGEGKDEKGIIADLSQFIEKHRPVIVTYNGRTFDLPVIAHRALEHGIPLKWYFQGKGYRYRYSDDGHCDLCDQLSEFGAARAPSLDVVCRLMGLPGKFEVEGAEVGSMHAQGRLAEIQVYCLLDVIQTGFLFARHRLVAGVIDRDAYRNSAVSILEGVEKDGRFGPFLAKIDRKALLLEE